MSALASDELLPWWMHRQTDPASPDVLIGEEVEHNSTHRSWTLLGTVGDGAHAAIDPRGLVTPHRGGFSLDWWVGADDRWHLPSRSAGVRQRLVDDSPVVETSMRVPGGEVVHRAWAVAAGDGVPPGGAVVIELTNASAVPVAIAFALRPFDPIGRTRISRIDLLDGSVLVDGHVAVHLARTPSRVAVGSAVSGDVLGAVTGGAAAPQWPVGGVHCAQGRASAALLHPLPHTATIRVLLPLGVPSDHTPRRSRLASSIPTVVSPNDAVDASRVVAGWEVQTRRSPRIEVLERRAPEALRAARRFALLHAAGDDAESWSEGLVDVFDDCALIVALDQHGLHAEAARLLMGLDDRIDVDGRFEQEHDRIDASAAWLLAVARHVELADDAVLASSVSADLAKIAHRMHRDVLAPDDRRRSRRRSGPAWTADRVAVRVHELIWSHSALGAAASTLRIADQPAAADAIDGLVPSVRAALDEVLSGALDAEAATAAVVAFVDSDSPLVRAGAVGFDALVDQVTADGLESAIWLAVGRAGLSPGLAGSIGTALARRGDPAAVLALRWFLEVGEPTWAWPTAVHPRTGGGSAGDGHSPASTAAFLRLVRSLAALDDDEGIDLLPVVPTEWLGQSIEVHDLPTRHGRLSFAIRWHGERPALLWDLVGQADPAIAAGRGPSASVTLRCSGLDPDWSSTEQRGEALLSAPPAPPSVELGGDEAEPDEVTTMRATEPVEPPAPGGSFS